MTERIIERELAVGIEAYRDELRAGLDGLAPPRARTVIVPHQALRRAVREAQLDVDGDVDDAGILHDHLAYPRAGVGRFALGLDLLAVAIAEHAAGRMCRVAGRG